MPERPNGTVSKTVEGSNSPGVQIPLLPPDNDPALPGRFFLAQEVSPRVYLSGWITKEIEGCRAPFILLVDIQILPINVK